MFLARHVMIAHVRFESRLELVREHLPTLGWLCLVGRYHLLLLFGHRTTKSSNMIFVTLVVHPFLFLKGTSAAGIDKQAITSFVMWVRQNRRTVSFAGTARFILDYLSGNGGGRYDQ